MTNKWNLILLTAVTVCLVPHCTESANILAFLPTFSPSHLIIEMAVIRAMAERNHNITVLSVLPLKSEWLQPNMIYKQLNTGSIDTNMIINATRAKGFGKIGKTLGMVSAISSKLAEILDDPIFQELLHNPGNKYDLMLFGYIYGEFFFGVAEHFDCPVAILWPNIPIAPILILIGSPLEISYTALTLLSSVFEESGFLFRLNNMLPVIDEILTACAGESKKVYE